MIRVSAPGKIHLLGEHAVVYGKPALLTTIDLRVTVTVIPTNVGSQLNNPLRKIIEPIVKKELKIKTIPPYNLTISSQLPIGCGLGSSAAVSAAYIGALLSYLKITWNLELINNLTYEAEKVFHGNPSGADNSAVVHGGLIWFRKEDPALKLLHPLNFTIPPKLARNFVIINTGKPQESTRDMVVDVKALYDKEPELVNKFLEEQEKLIRELLNVIKNVDEKEFIRIIRKGEKNLESIGVCSPSVKKIIRKIERAGGAAKICGAGGKRGPTGVLLCYHKDEHSSSANKKVVQKIAKSYNLPYFSTTLGVEGVRIEKT